MKTKRFRVRGTKDEVYEEAAVKYVIKSLGLPQGLATQLWRENVCPYNPDLKFLTFHDFCSWTKIPIYLGSCHLGHVRQLPLSSILRNFESSHVFRAFTKLRSRAEGYTATALVFNIPNFKFMCLHDADYEFRASVTQMTVPGDSRTYVVEPLKCLMKTFNDSEWRKNLAE
jgi:hypothetical protein